MSLGRMKSHSSVLLLAWPTFLLVFVLVFTQSLAQKSHTASSVRNSFTVAGINVKQDRSYAVITFYQSQRFYKLLHTPRYQTYIQLLRHSQKSKTQVYIYRRSEYSDTIASVAIIPRKH